MWGAIIGDLAGSIYEYEQEKEGNSIGNGAMMRISPIGFMFNTEEEVIENSRLTTIPSHNTEEAINTAKTIALIIYYARIGLSKEEIIDKLNIKLKFEPFKTFNYTCGTTIDNCLYALFTSDSFEESIIIWRRYRYKCMYSGFNG